METVVIKSIFDDTNLCHCSEFSVDSCGEDFNALCGQSVRSLIASFTGCRVPGKIEDSPTITMYTTTLVVAAAVGTAAKFRLRVDGVDDNRRFVGRCLDARSGSLDRRVCF